MDRYARQTILPELGTDGQVMLSAAKISVVGCGGLGNPAALYLAGAGIGHLTLVDGDVVDTSNLHRQVGFTEADVGRPKADALADRLRALNSDIEVVAIPSHLTADNALELLAGADVVVDASDNFATRFLINDAALILDIPVVFAAIQGFEGQVSVFWGGHGPCYRCLVPDRPKADIQNCAEAGVIGALPGMLGAAQALEAVKLVVGHPDLPPALGRIWYLDLRMAAARTFNLAPRNGCICQADRQSINLKRHSAPSPAPVMTAQDMSRLAFAPVLIDVRAISEWRERHVPGAIHCPLPAIQTWHDSVFVSGERILDTGQRQEASGAVATLDAAVHARLRAEPDTPVLCYCASGQRSATAASLLSAIWSRPVYTLRGGLSALPQSDSLT